MKNIAQVETLTTKYRCLIGASFMLNSIVTTATYRRIKLRQYCHDINAYTE